MIIACPLTVFACIIQGLLNKNTNSNLVEQTTDKLFDGVSRIINRAKRGVAIYVNVQSNMMFWQVGKYIISELKYENYSDTERKFLRHCRKD